MMASVGQPSDAGQLLSNDAEVDDGGRIRITLPDGTTVFADLGDLDGLDAGQFDVLGGREVGFA